MIELHRFALSHYSEKARLLLDFKGLDYKIVNHAPGVGQLDVVRLSGQRKVPFIVHDGRTVHDSTEIAHYLERAFPDARTFFPGDEPKRAEILALEDRLDTVLGTEVPLAFLAALARDRDVAAKVARASMLGGVGAGAVARIFHLAGRFGPTRARAERAEQAVRATLRELGDKLERSRYLAGDEPSVADLTAAGLTLTVRMPHSRYLAIPELAGWTAPALAGDPKIERFFAYKDELYARFAK